MKTSLHDTGHIEKYLSGSLSPEERLVFDARLLVDPLLRGQVVLQKKVYSLIKLYGRKKLRAEAEAVHQQLFQDPEKEAIRQEIFQFFKKP